LPGGGFDIGLGVALVATAVAVARRSAYAEVAAAVCGTLLVCDAWFDLLTSRTTSAVVQAALEAALVELPLAALCFWMAVNLARAVEVARPFLRAAGFRIEDNRLLPSEDSSGS
jgi:dolichyl-phosphate-mannose--protein O-mannosyl transferase